MRAGYIDNTNTEQGNSVSLDDARKSSKHKALGTTAAKKQSIRFSPLKMVMSVVALAVFGVLAFLPFLNREQAVNEFAALNVDPTNLSEVQTAVNNGDIDAIPQDNTAAAFMNMCAGIGSGMNTNSSGGFGNSNMPHSDKSNRKWTLQEAYGDGAKLSVYYGEGEGDWFTANVGTERGADYGNYSDFADNIFTEQRGFANCFLAPIASHFIPWIPFEFANITSNITSWIASLAFSSNFICQDPANPSGGCVNLIGLIGGDDPNDSEGGLIGALTSSIYMPLVLFPVLIGAFALIYTGIIKRQFREAMFQVLWMVGAFVIGLGLLLNPLFIARAPMSFMNAVTACIVGAINGESCLEDTSTTSASGTTDAQENWGTRRECLSNAGGLNADEQMEMIVNGMTCNIYMAFNIQPWSQAMFGRSYDDMDTSNERTAEVISAAGLNASDFEVNLASTESVDSMLSSSTGTAMITDNMKAFTLDSDPVSNVAAYQLMLGSNAEGSGSPDPLGDHDNTEDSDPQVDARWFNLVVYAANDADTWSNWAPAGDTMHRIGIGFLAMLSSVMGGVIIVIVSAFALVYYIGTAILMAFAPVFFLLAIHPSRGRRIFLGWFEKVVSNVLKYIASALFLLVTIMFYGAVLGNADGIGTAFIFVLILTMALFMYRKEIVDLIGRANMGGEQLSSAMTDRLKQGVGRAGQVAKAGVAGAAGGMVAGAMSGEGKAARRHAKEQGKGFFAQQAAGARANFKHSAGGALTGARNEAGRDLQFGRGVVGGVSRQVARTKGDMAAAGKLSSQQEGFGQDPVSTAQKDSTQAYRQASDKEADTRMSGATAVNNLRDSKGAHDESMAGKRAEYDTLHDKAEKDRQLRRESIDDTNNTYTEDAMERGADAETAESYAKAGEQYVRLSLEAGDIDRINQGLQQESAQLNLQLEDARASGDEDAAVNIEQEISGLGDRMLDNQERINQKHGQMSELEDTYNQEGELSQYVGQYNAKFEQTSADQNHSFTADEASRMENIASDINEKDAAFMNASAGDLNKLHEWRESVASKAAAQGYDKHLKDSLSKEGSNVSPEKVEAFKSEAEKVGQTYAERAREKFDEKNGTADLMNQTPAVDNISASTHASGAGYSDTPNPPRRGGDDNGNNDDGGGGSGGSGGDNSGGGSGQGYQGRQEDYRGGGDRYQGNTGNPDAYSVDPDKHARSANQHERQQDEKSSRVPTFQEQVDNASEVVNPHTKGDFGALFSDKPLTKESLYKIQDELNAFDRNKTGTQEESQALWKLFDKHNVLSTSSDSTQSATSQPPAPEQNQPSRSTSQRSSSRIPKPESSMPVSPQDYAQGADHHERQQDSQEQQPSRRTTNRSSGGSDSAGQSRLRRGIPKSDSKPLSPQEYAQSADAYEQRQDNRFDPNAQQGVPVKRDSRTGKYRAEGVSGFFDTAREAFQAANPPRRRNSTPKRTQNDDEG